MCRPEPPKRLCARTPACSWCSGLPWQKLALPPKLELLEKKTATVCGANRHCPHVCSRR